MHHLVTPHAGVRIEMAFISSTIREMESPPTRGCELKC